MLWGLGLCDTGDAHTRGEQLPWHSEPKPAPCPCCPWGLVALQLPHLILWREITTTVAAGGASPPAPTLHRAVKWLLVWDSLLSVWADVESQNQECPGTSKDH